MLSVLFLSTMVYAEEASTVDGIPFSFNSADQVVDTQEIPSIWVQCQPLSGLLELEQLLPDTIRNGSWGIGDAGIVGFKNAGGDPSGQMRAYGSQDLVLEIPFNGSDEQIPEMLNILHPEALTWKGSDSTWQMEFPDDHWVVTRTEEGLVLQSTSLTENENLPEQVSYIEKVQPKEGCWLSIQSNQMIPNSKIPLSGSMFVPFGEGPLSVLYTPKNPLPLYLKRSGVQPMDLSTTMNPTVVGVLGFDWNELFLDPTVQQQIGMSEEDAKKLGKRLRIQPGGLIAFENINIRKDPKVSVGLELNNRWRRPQSSWLIWKGIKQSLGKAGIDYLVLEDRILSFENNAQAIYIGVSKGRILLSNTRQSVDQMMLNEGTPWVDESLQQLALDNAVAVQVKIPQMVGMMFGGLESVDIGLGTAESMMRISMEPTLSSGQNWTTLLPLLASQLPDPLPRVEPNSVEIQLQTLAAKEHQHFLKEGYYKPMGRTGLFVNPDITVDLSILDSAPVVESGVAIGWMEQSEDAIYWIETTEESFMVHVLAMIGGQMIHLMKDQNGVLEKTLLENDTVHLKP